MAEEAKFIPDKEAEAEARATAKKQQEQAKEEQVKREIHTSDQFLAAIPNARWQATATARLTTFTAALTGTEPANFAAGLTKGDQRAKFAAIVRFTDVIQALALARANGWI